MNVCRRDERYLRMQDILVRIYWVFAENLKDLHLQ